MNNAESKSSIYSNVSESGAESGTESVTDNTLTQENYVSENNNSTINENNIIILQFQPQFQAVILLGMFLSIIAVSIDVTLAFSTAPENIPLEYSSTLMGIIYCTDLIYVIDILLMLIYKNSNWSDLEHLYEKRSALLIMLDVISVIPLDAVYFSLTIANMQLVYLLRLRYIVRIFRFMLKFNQTNHGVGHSFVYLELLLFAVKITLIVSIATCVMYILLCSNSRVCKFLDNIGWYASITIVFQEFTNQGVINVNVAPRTIRWFTLALKFWAFLYASAYIVAIALLKLVYVNKKKYSFQNMQNNITKNMEICGCSDNLIISTGKRFSALYWKNIQGLNFKDFDCKVIPETMLKDINLDICWDALKHSHLFRNKDVHFLRVIASMMTQKFMIPGEVIFKQGQLKTSMVYVSSGAIQILSEVDAETPIVSLTRGTCIGEMSLFVSNTAISTVICQSYCELYVLKKKKLMSIILKHSDQFKSLRLEVQNIYAEIIMFEELLRKKFTDENNQRENLSLKWLKMTFQELTASDQNSLEGKVLSLEERRTIDVINSQIFSATYLDTLVLCEEIELITDTVFMKVSCPCVIQPDSFVIEIWNYIISFTAFIFLYIYPYYASFEPNTSLWFVIFSYTVLLLWVLDIYINLSTAIKTRDQIISNFNEIFMMKASKITFFMDVAAVIPLELLVLLIMDLSDQWKVLYQMPRLIKFYKIQFLFEKTLPKIGGIAKCFLEYAVYMSLLMYYLAAIMYFNICFNGVCDEFNVYAYFISEVIEKKEYPVFMWIYLSIQIITNLRMPLYDPPTKQDNKSFNVMIAIFQLIICYFTVYFISSTAAITALVKQESYEIQNYITRLKISMKLSNVRPQLQKQVLRHIEGQIEFNQGFNILYSYEDLRTNFHSDIYNEFRSFSYVEYIKKIPVFKNLPDNFLSAVAQAFHINLVVPNEVITYFEEVSTEMHVIMSGFCAIVNHTGKVTKILKPGDSLSVVELFFKIPVANTIVALTHCKLCSANYGNIMKCLQAYPNTLWQITSLVNLLTITTNIDAIYDKDYCKFNLNLANDKKKVNYINIGYLSSEDETSEFHAYFAKHEYLGFLKYMLLRIVFTSHGNYVKYWEVSRCIFALLTAILSPVMLINPCPNCVMQYILYFLDFTAWVDIYLRHHVTYFNKINIEIRHPVKTAFYYWKHSFIVDLIAVIPFELIFNASNQVKVFLRLMRYLQVYRIFGMINYLSSINYKLWISREIWTTVKFSPLLLLLIVGVSSAYIFTICDFDQDIPATNDFTKGVHCDANTWLVNSAFAKPLTPLRVYLYSVYAATVINIRPAIGGFTIANQLEAVQVIVFLFLSVSIYLYISSMILAVYINKNIDLPLYQQAMSSLVKFLSYRRIDGNLRKEIILHFEFVWQRMRGINLNQIIQSSCIQSLQEDVLFDVFGSMLSKSKIFEEANPAFFRSILLNCKHEIVMKKGLITQVNNVHGNIYILFKGQVDVLGPDYNRLLVLPVGSFFGNIDNFPLSRQTLTMVAKGHVELLTIESTKFHDVLSKYPHLKIKYNNLIGLNADYILSADTSSDNDYLSKETLRTTTSRAETIMSLKSINRLDNVINIFKDYRKLIILLWELFILIIPCFIGFLMEMYSFTIIGNNYYIVIALYLFDALFVIKIILTFFTEFEDEYGILVTDKITIALTYIKDPKRFAIDLAAVFPFEIIALFFLNSFHFWTVWSYCRSNRFIKLYFIITYLNKKNQQLNINVKTTRFITVTFWMCIVLQTSASFLIIISCLNPQFNTQPLQKCNWAALTSIEKFEVYEYHLIIVLHILTMSSLGYYIVNSSALIVSVVFIILICRAIQITIMAEIAATLISVQQNRDKFKNNIETLRKHMVNERASTALLDRVWLYVTILWKKKYGLQFPTLLEEAPYYLKEAVMNSMFGFHLRKHPVFGQCHEELIRQMAAQMQTRMFLNNDCVTFMNDCDECMYFIHEGSVDALNEDQEENEKVELIYNENSMFGFHQGLFVKSGHEYSYRANRFTIIVILQRSKWIHLLNFFPASREIIFDAVKKL